MAARSNDLENYIQKMLPNLTRLLGEKSSRPTGADRNYERSQTKKRATVAGSRYAGMAKKAAVAAGAEGPKRSVVKKKTVTKKK